MTVVPSEPAPEAPPLPLPEDTVPMTAGQPAHRRLRSRLRLRVRRRWLLLGGAAVVVFAVAGGVGLAYGGGKSTPATQYRPVAATTGTMRLTTAAGGTLQPAQLDNLNFGVSGQVTGVSVKVGQHVKAGQTLATVTSASLAAQVAQAQAALDSDRAKTTADQNAGASSSQVNADEAAESAAQQQLSSAQASLAQATLKSPITGTVAQLNLTVGQQVGGGSGSGSSSSGGSGNGSGSGSGNGGGSGSSGGSSSSSGSGSASSSAQVVVVGPAFVVNVPVDDTQIGLMKDGEQAVIVPQGGTTPVYGTVTSVGLLASSSSGVASFPVVVTITGTPSGLFAGSSATVTIVYRQLSNVVQVPTAAVHYSGGKATVLQSHGSGTVSVPVTVGVTANGFTQITAGLTDGQQVLVAAGGAGGGARTGGGTGTGRTGTRGGGTGYGGGGFGGGGFGGGGFGGGGFGGRTGGGTGGGTGGAGR